MIYSIYFGWEKIKNYNCSWYKISDVAIPERVALFRQNIMFFSSCLLPNKTSFCFLSFLTIIYKHFVDTIHVNTAIFSKACFTCKERGLSNIFKWYQTRCHLIYFQATWGLISNLNLRSIWRIWQKFILSPWIRTLPRRNVHVACIMLYCYIFRPRKNNMIKTSPTFSLLFSRCCMISL